MIDHTHPFWNTREPTEEEKIAYKERTGLNLQKILEANDKYFGFLEKLTVSTEEGKD